MAKNTGKGHREGAVRDRSLTFNSVTGRHVKRDTPTGRCIDQKSDNKRFTGVRQEWGAKK